MAAPVEAIPDDQHPAVLLVRAHELEREADELAEQAKAKRAESCKLRARAERFRDGEHLAPAKPEPPDTLMAAAALAVEDLEGTWELRDLMDALQLRDGRRAAKIVYALMDMDLVTKTGEKWRTVDPLEADVRDELREMGTGTREELAERLELKVEALEHYLALGVQREWCYIAEDGHLMFLKTGPERTITSRPRRRAPEHDPPAYTDVPRRGEPVRVVNHGDRGTRSGQANRHQIKQRDARYAKMQAARAERSEKDKAKAADDKPSGYSGKRNPRRKKKK